MTTLNTLGDLNFAFARKQGNSTHLAQVHADGIVSFFKGARSKVEFDILSCFEIYIEFLVEVSPGHFGAFEHINALRTDRGEQIVKVVRRINIARKHIVHLTICEVPFFLANIDQFLNIVVFVVESQRH